MRICLSVLIFVVGAAVVAADDPKPAKKPDAAAIKADDKEKDAKPKLGIGDPVPKMVVAKWLKGDAVNSFEPNMVYVLEFWATWCGPCVAAMPHLSDLQHELKSQGLVIIGVTSKAQNSEEDVTKFMAKKGERMRYASAFCETDETDTAFMKAADQHGIPCSFVIDRSGKVAYIGHPMMLDDVLPKVLDGTWKGQKDIEAIEKIQEEFFGILGKATKEPDTAIRELADFDDKHPNKKNAFADQRFIIFVSAKKWDTVKTLADQLIAKAIAKKDSGSLGLISYVLASDKMNPEKKHVDLAVKAAEAGLKLDGEDDTRSLLALADAHLANGAKDKAIEFGEKALKSTDNEDFKKYIDARLKVYKGEKDGKEGIPAAKIKPAGEDKKKDN
jgi:thiol-disulfide isomerase/thioredoxin